MLQCYIKDGDVFSYIGVKFKHPVCVARRWNLLFVRVISVVNKPLPSMSSQEVRLR